MSQHVSQRSIQPAIQKTVHVVGVLSNTFAAISGLLLVVLAVQVTIDVSRRNLLNTPLPGTNEFITYWWMPMIVFLAIPLVEKKQTQLSVTLLTDSIADKNRSLSILMGRLFSILVTLIVFYLAVESLSDSLQSMQTASGGFPVPIWAGKGVMVFGLSLLLFQMLANLIFFYTNRKSIEKAEVVEQ